MKKISSFFVLITMVLCWLCTCVFEQEDPEFEYDVKYGEEFMSYGAKFTIDKNRHPHILANVNLLYTKKYTNPDYPEIMLRGNTTYHYSYVDGKVLSHGFENMLGNNSMHTRLITSPNTDNLYAVVQDLSKYIIYMRESGDWKKVRSLSLKMEEGYHINADYTMIYEDEIYMPFYSFFYNPETWYPESSFRGIQINGQSFFNTHQVDSQYVDGDMTTYAPAIIEGTVILPVSYLKRYSEEWSKPESEDDDVKNTIKHLICLYRITKDTIKQETLQIETDTYLSDIIIKQAKDTSFMFVIKGDSIDIYNINKEPAELLRSYNNENYQAFSTMIDDDGCIHRLSNFAFGNNNENADSKRSMSTKTLFYTKTCDDDVFDSIPFPDTLKDYKHHSTYSSAVDEKGNIFIITFLSQPQTASTKYSRYSATRLYLISKENNEWIFTLLDEK
ncbi:MAG: hypothetical protein HQK83_04800 [Fibrobacteria bacterium]|nr:hypothetical protein [Fibrobacteria bacterium]